MHPSARWTPSWTPHRNGRGAPAVEVASYAPAVRIDLATIVVDDYDRAVEFFVGALGFELVEDSAALTNDGRPKRWVVVRPPGAETGILLARADGERQARRSGTRRRAGSASSSGSTTSTPPTSGCATAGVEFVTSPRDEPYGRVAVFVDIAGNRWDLLGAR